MNTSLSCRILKPIQLKKPDCSRGFSGAVDTDTLALPPLAVKAIREGKMEQLQILEEIINRHAKEDGIITDGQSVINFLDHISRMGDRCEKCAKAMSNYTDGEIITNA